MFDIGLMLNNSIYFLFGLYALSIIYHIFLFYGNKNNKSHLYFALLSLAIIYSTLIKYNLYFNVYDFNQIFGGFSLFFSGISTQMIIGMLILFVYHSFNFKELKFLFFYGYCILIGFFGFLGYYTYFITNSYISCRLIIGIPGFSFGVICIVAMLKIVKKKKIFDNKEKLILFRGAFSFTFLFLFYFVGFFIGVPWLEIVLVNMGFLLLSIAKYLSISHEYNTTTSKLLTITNSYEKKIKKNLDYISTIKQKIQQEKESEQRKYNKLVEDANTLISIIYNNLQEYFEDEIDNNKLSDIKMNFDILITHITNYFDRSNISNDRNFLHKNKIINLSLFIQQESCLYQILKDKRKSFKLNMIENNILIFANPIIVQTISNNLFNCLTKQLIGEYQIEIQLYSKNNRATLEISIVQLQGISTDNKTLQTYSEYNVEEWEKLRNIVINNNGQYYSQQVSQEKTLIKISFIQFLNTNKNEKKINSYIKNKSLVSPVMFRKPNKQNRVNYPNILIVLENTALLKFLLGQFKNIYNTFAASNGDEALLYLNNIPYPELILSGIDNDSKKCFNFINQIKQDSKYSSIPFLFIGYDYSQKNILDSFQKGALDYIRTPFSINELIAKIDSWIVFNKIQKSVIQKEYNDKIKAFIEKDNHEENYNDMNELFLKYKISQREKEVIFLLLKGLQDKEISNLLQISITTIRTHIRHIYDKCSVNNRVELLNIFHENQRYIQNV